MDTRSTAPAGPPSAGPNQEPRKDAPGNAQVQSEMDKHVEQGYRGDKVDERPNEDYTVAGVTKRNP